MSFSQYWWSCTPSQYIGLFLGSARFLCWMPPFVFFGLLPLDLLSEYRIQHGAIGPLLNSDILQRSFKLCNWLSLRRLVSWIHHLPPVCLSTFWKSIFKQQLGGRLDKIDCKSSLFCIMTYAIVNVLIHHMIFHLCLFFLYSGLYFVSSTLVLTVSTGVVFILPIETYPP